MKVKKSLLSASVGGQYHIAIGDNAAQKAASEASYMAAPSPCPLRRQPPWINRQETRRHFEAAETKRRGEQLGGM